MEEKEEIKKTENILLEDKTDNTDHFKFFDRNWKYNIVTDEDAPLLYSRKTIYFFSCFFSVLTGGILLFINLKKVNRKDVSWIVLGYSIAYTAITAYILNQFKTNSVLNILVAMLGSFTLFNFFWKKYIGAETKYQTKPIWIPLVICISIFGLLAWAIIATDSY